MTTATTATTATANGLRAVIGSSKLAREAA